MTVFAAFVVQWIMPLFFIVSGESTYFSLASRTGRQYVLERFKRLIIPFTFGIFVLAPPQVYLERLSNSQFTGSFIQFYPQYFDGLYGFGGNFAWMGLHLWYLLFLFIFSLITLPIFLHLKKETLSNSPSKIAAFFEKPGAIFLLALPLALTLTLTELSFQPDGLLGKWSGFVHFGGWNLFMYIIFFIYGYLLASDRFKRVIRKHGRIALITGVISSIPMTLLLTSWSVSFFRNPLEHILIYIFSAFYSWVWIIAILSLGSANLGFDPKWLKEASEAVLPFYVLHQTVILTIGFYVVSLDLSIISKYLLISTLSMTTIIILVLIIRRIHLLRFIFGMRTRRMISS